MIRQNWLVFVNGKTIESSLTFGSIEDVVGQEVAVFVKKASYVVVDRTCVMRDLKSGPATLGRRVDVWMRWPECAMQLDSERVIRSGRKATLLFEI